jgi:hypothetical protein
VSKILAALGHADIFWWIVKHIIDLAASTSTCLNILSCAREYNMLYAGTLALVVCATGLQYPFKDWKTVATRTRFLSTPKEKEKNPGTSTI